MLNLKSVLIRLQCGHKMWISWTSCSGHAPDKLNLEERFWFAQQLNTHSRVSGCHSLPKQTALYKAKEMALCVLYICVLAQDAACQRSLFFCGENYRFLSLSLSVQGHSAPSMWPSGGAWRCCNQGFSCLVQLGSQTPVRMDTTVYSLS